MADRMARMTSFIWKVPAVLGLIALIAFMVIVYAWSLYWWLFTPLDEITVRRWWRDMWGRP